MVQHYNSYLCQPGINNLILLTIDSCIFTDNGKAKSIVYIDGYSQISVTLQNSQNNGVPLHISRQCVKTHGSITLKNNNGGGIVSDKSLTVKFSKHTHASFLGNVADNGAAMHSTENSRLKETLWCVLLIIMPGMMEVLCILVVNLMSHVQTIPQ